MAISSGAFAREIVPVIVPGRGGDMLVDTDEQPGKARPEKIALLKPAFAEAGTITAANASSISDGAAALVMTLVSVAKKLDLPLVAKVVAHAAPARAPGLFTTAPVPALRTVLQRAVWSVDAVELFEMIKASAITAGCAWSFMSSGMRAKER